MLKPKDVLKLNHSFDHGVYYGTCFLQRIKSCSEEHKFLPIESPMNPKEKKETWSKSYLPFKLYYRYIVLVYSLT